MSSVPCRRLARISRRRRGVQSPAIDVPARCTTASTPSSAAASIAPADGSQWAQPAPGSRRRVRRTTSCPPVVRNAASDTADEPAAAGDRHAQPRHLAIARHGARDRRASARGGTRRAARRRRSAAPAAALRTTAGPGSSYSTWSSSTLLSSPSAANRCSCRQRANGPSSWTSVNPRPSTWSLCTATQRRFTGPRPYSMTRRSPSAMRAPALDHAETLPRRREALEGARARVPGVELADRDGHGAALLEDRHDPHPHVARECSTRDHRCRDCTRHPVRTGPPGGTCPGSPGTRMTVRTT